jgi:hypothetical protein
MPFISRKWAHLSRGASLEARDLQPIYAPFAPVITSLKSLSARPGLAFVVVMVVFALLWLVL